MLRRFEKDFLFQLDKSYLIKFQHSKTDFEKDLQQLINMNLYGLNTEEVQHLANSFIGYLKSFDNIVNLQFALGLNHQDGYYAKLRNQAHEIEKILARATDENLMNHLLSMRRFEKDFMLRSTITDLEEWRTQVNELKNLVQNEVMDKNESNQLINLLTIYEKDLNTYADNRLAKGLSNKDGLTKELIQQAHEIENEINNIKNKLHLQLINFEKTIHYLTYGCIVVFLGGPLLILFTLLFFFLYTKTRYYEFKND